jgi:hypothetical protein
VLRRSMIVLALLAVVGPAGTARAASTGVSDLKAGADPATGKVGALVNVQLHEWNLGPDDAQTGDVVEEYKAPTGAELVGYPRGDGTLHFNFPPSSCTWLVPKTDIRCIVGVPVTVAQFNSGSSAPFDHGGMIQLRIVKPITAPGRYTLTCRTGTCRDPKTANNSALLVLNGVRAPKPTPTPTPKPTPKPAATSAQPSVAVAPASPSDPAPTVESVSATPPTADGPSPLTLVAAGQDDSTATVVLWTSIGLLIVAAAATTVVTIRRRRDPTD